MEYFSLNFHLIQRKTWLMKDFKLTMLDLSMTSCKRPASLFRWLKLKCKLKPPYSMAS